MHTHKKPSFARWQSLSMYVFTKNPWPLLTSPDLNLTISVETLPERESENSKLNYHATNFKRKRKVHRGKDLQAHSDELVQRCVSESFSFIHAHGHVSSFHYFEISTFLKKSPQLLRSQNHKNPGHGANPRKNADNKAQHRVQNIFTGVSMSLQIVAQKS